MQTIADFLVNLFKKPLLRNPHFYAIAILNILIAYVYYFWPWTRLTSSFHFLTLQGWLSWLEDLALFEFQHRMIGIFFLIPTVYGGVVFRWKGAVISWIFSLVVIMPLVINLWQGATESMITNLGFLLLPLLAISVAAMELERRSRERKTAAAREEERQKYVAKVLEAQENERKRIAQELHDETIQTLLLILGYAETLKSPDGSPDPAIKDNAEKIRETTINAVENLRRICLDLRPSILDHLGLIAALRWLVDNLNKESSIKAHITIAGKERKLPPQVESSIFRIVQEALNNIRRHAGAKNAMVTAEFSDTLFKLSVFDDGHGFQVPRDLSWLTQEGSLGLIGMQQRINSLGGAFQIHSTPGEGTLLSFQLAL
jgi:two-component system, NarL family, sensor histidine kinase DegS